MKMTNSKKQKGSVEGTAGLLVIAIAFACIFGWGANVYKFINCDFKAPVKAEIIRGIGIPLWPMGVFVGYMDINDTPVKESSNDNL